MLKKTDFINDFVKNRISEKRYIHSCGVASVCKTILDHYGKPDETYNGICSSYFCGMCHDLGREISDSKIIEYCKNNNINLTEEETNAPVLAHGKVSATIAQQLIPGYPAQWKKAIEEHTCGSIEMSDLSLALFVADYIEPSRTFMTDEKRAFYLSRPSLEECAYEVLLSMVKHWEEKENFTPSANSKNMLQWLEEYKR